MRAEEITSFDDPRVDVYRNVRDADLRGREGMFMAESELVIRRLLRMPERLHSLLLSKEKFARLESELLSLPDSAPVYVVDLKLMHEIAAFHIHRGCLAAGWRLQPETLSLDAALGHLRGRERFTLVLAEGVTNVDNMGGLFRNAAAFGVDGIVLDPTCCDPLYRKAIRVSMGHALSIPYAMSDHWPADLQRLRAAPIAGSLRDPGGGGGWGATLIAAEHNDRALPLWQMPRASRVAIIFGSEGHGISPATLDLCDAVCEIPMAGAVPSLNVATASAVVLYELRRDEARSAPRRC